MVTRIFRYLSHPQVRIDPLVPVPDWGLSDLGRQRVLTLKESRLLRSTGIIVSSGERKARETASIIGHMLGLGVSIDSESHENDRSSTGFLPPSEFEEVATQFFSEPCRSVRGWERAVDAQARIVTVAERYMINHTTGDILMVGHGGVGTLLFCHFTRVPISRAYDQPAGGGGNFWSMDAGSRQVLHGWRSLEDLNG